MWRRYRRGLCLRQVFTQAIEEVGFQSTVGLENAIALSLLISFGIPGGNTCFHPDQRFAASPRHQVNLKFIVGMLIAIELHSLGLYEALQHGQTGALVSAQLF